MTQKPFTHIKAVLVDMAYCRELSFSPAYRERLNHIHAVALLAAAIRDTRHDSPNAIGTLCRAVKHITPRL